MGAKLSQETVIQRFRWIHANTYDYSLFKYESSSVKSTIICKIHGPFEQKPDHHLRGQGCKKCANLIISRTNSKARFSYTGTVDSESAVIALTKGKYAFVDLSSYELLSKYTWYFSNKEGCVTYISGKRTSMHRFLMDNPEGFVVDHKDHNNLNNRTSNLRICSQKNNTRNTSSRSGSSSKYLGVTWNKKRKKWLAYCKDNFGKHKNLGGYLNEIDAAKAYDQYAARIFGEFANLNFK